MWERTEDKEPFIIHSQPTLVNIMIFLIIIFLQQNGLAILKTSHYSNPVYEQCSAKALEKWGQMTHTIEKCGDVGNF